MQVITSHSNADFDTLASMVAAKKLYPEASVVFSGSLEKSLRDVLSSLDLPITIEKIKDVDLNRVDRVILVDVNTPGRLGVFDEVVMRTDVEVHIYDHHPVLKETLKAAVAEIKPFGSTATVLTLILKEKKIDIGPDEATIILCGIYEDTGSLSFPSTTVQDFEAAGYLLAKGANLSEAAGFLKKELTAKEVALLDEFLHAETTYNFGGAEVIVAEGYLEDYRGDIAVIAHKIMDIEGRKCLFLLADAKDRVYAVARSAVDQIDVGAVARELGGGGHAQAASASLKDMTLVQAKEALLAALRKIVSPGRTARRIMSHPPIVVPRKMSVSDAAALMRRYNINAAPVADAKVFRGVLTRQVADKAVFHGLGLTPSEGYMTTDCETVNVDTSIDIIREMVVSRGARLLPVLKGKKVVGVITRTDLLKLLQEGLGASFAQSRKSRRLGRHMKERLPAWAHRVLEEAGQCAEKLGVNAYAVGGFVRDLLLNRENLDIDIVIENGDGIIFATAFAKQERLSVKPHPRFKTAVLTFPTGFKLDVATARLEYYERPGALPTIEQSSLKLDLYRRDFIINTLAVSLNPGNFGELVDFFGGQKDIKDKTIRVLHNLSFVEDPVRMMRSVRFAEKFGFTIGKHTANLLKNSVKL
ncbi:MAG: CBS domain-containing protein, partial [Nitrospirota bacterium]|nr:CBS domain-containing protein [Nitrospirota bacterium]